MTESLYADDAQVHVEYEVTSRDGDDVTFTPTATANGTPVPASWVSDAAPKRILRVDLSDLPAGNKELICNNPDGNDIYLDTVTLQTR